MYLIPMENSCIFRGDFKKVAILDEGVGSVSDGIYRFHWRLLHSDGNVDFLFVSYLEKFYSCWPNF